MAHDPSAPDVMDPAPPARGNPRPVDAGGVDARRLSILSVSHMPASPPRFGAQARMHGLMMELARRHDLTAVTLVDDAYDLDECRRAMQAYCRDVVLVRNPYGRDGLSKRLLQLRSLVSGQSFDRLRVALPELQRVLDRVLGATRFDIVNLEFPYLGHCRFRQAPAGEQPPRLIVDSHEIAYDLARQFAATGASLGRRLYAGANWRKLRREELAAYAGADGVYLCSTDDEKRLHDDLPNVCTAVIPNAADIAFYQPRSTDPAPDGRTVVYFGLLSTIPNIDAVTHFVQDIWPAIAARHPDARCKIIGGRPPPSLLALAGPRVELTGFVPDLRPHLASAAAVVVPLRLGGGTRLKIVEAMAMGKAIVSTSLGAEGIDARAGRDILIENDPAGFADAVSRLLAEPDLAARIGGAAREVAVDKYAWRAAAQALEGFYRRILETPPS
ncbi:glycosyl transferase family 1 [Bradyrhizobium sp. SSBR45G]|uniref:glycosyltransferase n=1 Tax=unclassified Bradyrhizobium TaxID=2631580 RepID=UPI0023429EAD|nr:MULTISPECIES: glycosyltransferase [unclassified Bradyrhizobium]GLH79950.1 glycosyl transferase family 1 [Bradyrhizobium sp. SSBR45G]GLH87326.1 glycosyl transferase family 1 [Bradyrhizobium sp. SSBR45R]